VSDTENTSVSTMQQKSCPIFGIAPSLHLQCPVTDMVTRATSFFYKNLKLSESLKMFLIFFI